jgi:AraC-like DNA-binding protein
MSMLFQADAAPPKTRRDYWRHIIEGAIGPLDLRVDGGLDSGDRLRVAEAGALRVLELAVSNRRIAERAQTHIRRLDLDVCAIEVHASGRGVVQQNGREARLAPGDLALLDLSRPCRCDYSSAEFVAVVFPRALLPLHPDELARLTGVRVPGDRGLDALISSLARQLPQRLDDCSPADRARLGTAVLDLVTAALKARLDGGQQVPQDSRPRELLLRVLAFIEERLGEPDLSPAGIAAAHFISLRYLYKLFETEHTTVADWIRRRRLERCRTELLDLAQRHTPVSTIAARWGFASAAHFSRAFRAAYGLPPAEYRAIGLRRGIRAAAESPGSAAPDGRFLSARWIEGTNGPSSRAR